MDAGITKEWRSDQKKKWTVGREDMLVEALLSPVHHKKTRDSQRLDKNIPKNIQCPSFQFCNQLPLYSWLGGLKQWRGPSQRIIKPNCTQGTQNLGSKSASVWLICPCWVPTLGSCILKHLNSAKVRSKKPCFLWFLPLHYRCDLLLSFPHLSTNKTNAWEIGQHCYYH